MTTPALPHLELPLALMVLAGTTDPYEAAALIDQVGDEVRLLHERLSTTLPPEWVRDHIDADRPVAMIAAANCDDPQVQKEIWFNSSHDRVRLALAKSALLDEDLRRHLLASGEKYARELSSIDRIHNTERIMAEVEAAPAKFFSSILPPMEPSARSYSLREVLLHPFFAPVQCDRVICLALGYGYYDVATQLIRSRTGFEDPVPHVLAATTLTLSEILDRLPERNRSEVVGDILKFYLHAGPLLNAEDIKAMQDSRKVSVGVQFYVSDRESIEEPHRAFTKDAVDHLLASPIEWARLAAMSVLTEDQFDALLTCVPFQDDQDELAVCTQVTSSGRLIRALEAMPKDYTFKSDLRHWVRHIKPLDEEMLARLLPHLPLLVQHDLVAGFGGGLKYQWPSSTFLRQMVSEDRLGPYAVANRLSSEAIEYDVDVPLWYLHRLIYLVPGLIPALAKIGGPESVRTYQLVLRALGPHLAAGLTLLENPASSLGSVLRALATLDRAST